MPACDGGAWPEANPSDHIQRQQIEFLAAYTQLNRLHDLLEKAKSTGQSKEEQAILQGLQRAIGFRDQLEDLYAPIGFYAEPIMDGHLTANLLFHHAQKFVRENHRRHEPIDVCVKIPLPDSSLINELAAVPGIPIEKILADFGLQRPRGDRNEMSQ